MTIEANIVLHTINQMDEELITVEFQLHRFILPEYNTHRVISRNFQSSRAVPVAKLIEQVRDNPAMPVHWGLQQRGMVADEELDETTMKEAKDLWLNAAQEAADTAVNMLAIGLHKQVANRILEPFMWTKGIATATRRGWESFFKLRSHPDAQPEIQALSDLIKSKVEASQPLKLSHGEWHLPYIAYIQDTLGRYIYGKFEGELFKPYKLEDAIKISTSCCAQVSYRVLDDSLDKANLIYDMLNLPKDGKFSDAPPHFSPCEHVALSINYTEFDYLDEQQLAKTGYNISPSEIGGNFQTIGYYQYRKLLEQGKESEYIYPKSLTSS